MATKTLDTNPQSSSLSGKYLAQGDNAIATMQGAAQTAFTGATSGSAAAADKARAGAGTTASKMTETATTMQGIGAGLLPLAEQVSKDAAGVRDIASQNLDASKPWLRQSEGLLKMDENAGGMSGEFAKLYKQLDPALQMSLAASDARKEAQAQTESATRALQRAGVSPTASALASIREKAAAQTAALVASVKTKARQSGVSLQMEALEKGVAMAISQAGVGQKFVEQASSGLVNAAQLEQLSGSLKSGAASIYGSSASLLSDAQQLVQAAANGTIQANSLQVSAANTMIQAFATAAEFYSVQASSIRGLEEEGGRII